MLGLFLDSRTKKEQKKEPTARGGLLLSFTSDFGEWLESLGLLWKHLEFFAYPASMQGMQKKGRV